jgi:hypothetical protein
MKLQMHGTDIRSAALSMLLPVRSVTDLEWLVKESEMITGKPGRHFVVAGGDRPVYQVQLDSSGFEVIRVDVDPLGAAPTHSSKPEFLQHPVASAMACGRLYTAKVH